MGAMPSNLARASVLLSWQDGIFIDVVVRVERRYCESPGEAAGLLPTVYMVERSCQRAIVVTGRDARGFRSVQGASSILDYISTFPDMYMIVTYHTKYRGIDNALIGSHLLHAWPTVVFQNRIARKNGMFAVEVFGSDLAAVEAEVVTPRHTPSNLLISTNFAKVHNGLRLKAEWMLFFKLVRSNAAATRTQMAID